MMRILLLAIFLSSGFAFGANNTAPSNFSNTVTIQAITNAGAGSDHTTTDNSDQAVLGKAMTANTQPYLSFQCNWASLTGSIDAVIKLQVSNDGVTWTDKTSATFTLAGASGNQDVSLVNATERYDRLVYTHTSVSGGTVNCFVTAKE